MRFGVLILPEHRWSHARAVWQEAERLGFDHAWTYDHVRWRWLKDDAWFASVPTLTAAAVVTSRIRIGTMVACPGLRHPITFAKECMTLDDISGGRMVCGIGAGGYDSDLLRQAALAPGARARRFEEFVALTDHLLRQRPEPFDGEHYRAADLVLRPACRRRPRMPLAVSAAGPRAMRVAARFAETWITSGTPGDFEAAPYRRQAGVLRAQMEAMQEACAEVGRDFSTLDRLLLTGAALGGVLDSVAAFEDAVGLFGELGFTDVVVHWPRRAFPYEASVAMLEDVAATVLPRHAEPVAVGGQP